MRRGVRSARATRFPVPPGRTPTGVPVFASAPITSIAVPSPPSVSTTAKSRERSAATIAACP
jgi:hypothetical protein